jgi:hypothetical protein
MILNAIARKGCSATHGGLHAKEMARPIGFEPTTCSFGGCHSIQLSYGRVRLILQEVPPPWRLS